MVNGSSFNGCIEEIPDIFVDNFEDANKKAYFLSHCHSDHTHGLYKRTFINNVMKNGAKIYMTEQSMKIITHIARNNHGIGNICEAIRPLKLSTTIVTIGDAHIEVTLIPAGHCLGSVMFLFRTTTQTILYTGDFRIRTNDIPKYAQLHKYGEPIRIDALYVDTTFIDKEYQEFAKRNESVDEMIDKVKEWLREPSHRVAIQTSANCGYEYVYNKIYKNLGIKVAVKPHVWDMYSAFPTILTHLTPYNNNSKVHLCGCSRKNCKHDENYIYQNFKLSAYAWSEYNEEEITWKDFEDGVRVCYATHCSRSELLNFVDYFEPAKIVGFPNVYRP